MLQHLISFALRYSADCALMGMTPDGHLYIEEYHGTDLEFIAQASYDADGSVLLTADELDTRRPFVPLTLPENSVTPQHYPPHPLNYGGARRRGLREPERLLDWVQPLSIAEKMTLSAALPSGVTLGQIAGIAESRVLAQAAIAAHTSVICRLLRLAILLPQAATAADGLPYDYDTLPLYIVHLLHTDHDTPVLTSEFRDFYGVRLQRPQDCLVAANRLWIAAGGDPNTGQRSQVHGWVIQR